MVNFSIMLLLSRLVPFSFYCVQDSKKFKIDDKFTNTIGQIMGLIRQQSGNSTYFVRKIAAQSLLPLLEFNQWLPEVYSCLK
jgi:glycopeptide antibiotics resistance protein